MSEASLRKRLAEGIEHVLESLTQGRRSEAKYELAKLTEFLGTQVRIHDPFYSDVLRDLRQSSDLLIDRSDDQDREALQLLWGTQKRVRSR